MYHKCQQLITLAKGRHEKKGKVVAGRETTDIKAAAAEEKAR